MEDVASIIESMKARFSSGFSYEDKNTIKRIYEEVFNRKFVRTSCSDCYRDAYIEIRNYLTNIGKMEKRKYILRKGVLLRPFFGSSEYYTANSITDAKAEEILAKNPDLISYFDSYPSDWNKKPKRGRQAKSENESLTEESAV